MPSTDQTTAAVPVNTDTYTTVATFTNKQAADACRFEILAKHSHVWVCVMNLGFGRQFDITVANVWGNRLPKDKIEAIKQTVKSFSEVAESINCVTGSSGKRN